MKKPILTDRIALVSTPWPVFNRPSIQLGALKAYVKKQIPELEIVAYHFFLQLAESIGYDVYKRISERTWIAESVYSALLYPENSSEIETFFYKKFRQRSKNSPLNFERLVKQVEETSSGFISITPWGRYGLVGFSICLCQLTSSLYFMREIKRRHPEVVTVAGGSLIAASSAEEILKAFPQIDVVIIGEGERPLTDLLKHLNQTTSLTNLPDMNGIVTRRFGQRPVKFSQTFSLSEIPQPDYQEYFDSMNTLAPEKRFFPVLPAEISRGCWWRSRTGPGGEKGCTFCNLNLQWDGYRIKKTEQVISEIDDMTSRYGLLSISFVDNVIPPKQTVSLFNALPELKKDFRLFCELRASVSHTEIRILGQAGADEVQIGIEALSTSLLKKMNKGVTAIQNIEVMKHCETFSVRNVSNLLICFPGSDEKDVSQTLDAIAFLQPFHPLKIVPFWLGLDSPIYQNYKGYGLKAVFNHPHYRVLFPSKIVDNVKFLIQDYRGDKIRMKNLWRPVIDAVSAWRNHYDKMHEKPESGPILSYRDGREFVIIRERRITGDPQNHRLKGQSRAIYLFCNHSRSLDEIHEKFPALGEKKIRAFLKMMTQKKLMFEENSIFLSLAVPVSGDYRH